MPYTKMGFNPDDTSFELPPMEFPTQYSTVDELRAKCHAMVLKFKAAQLKAVSRMLAYDAKCEDVCTLEKRLEDLSTKWTNRLALERSQKDELDKKHSDIVDLRSVNAKMALAYQTLKFEYDFSQGQCVASDKTLRDYLEKSVTERAGVIEMYLERSAIERKEQSAMYLAQTTADNRTMSEFYERKMEDQRKQLHAWYTQQLALRIDRHVDDA
jgi:hypothetical protein